MRCPTRTGTHHGYEFAGGFLIASRVYCLLQRGSELSDRYVQRVERIDPEHGGPFKLRGRCQGEGVATQGFLQDLHVTAYSDGCH